jgi:hypothetical protein
MDELDHLPISTTAHAVLRELDTDNEYFIAIRSKDCWTVHHYDHGWQELDQAFSQYLYVRSVTQRLYPEAGGAHNVTYRLWLGGEQEYAKWRIHYVEDRYSGTSTTPIPATSSARSTLPGSGVPVFLDWPPTLYCFDIWVRDWSGESPLPSDQSLHYTAGESTQREFRVLYSEVFYLPPPHRVLRTNL